MNLDALLFHFTDGLLVLGTLITAAATVASHVIIFAFWRSMAKTFDRPHRWYDTVADYFDEPEERTWGIFAIATVSLGCWSVWAWAQDDLPLQLFLELCLVVPIIGTWMGLLMRFSKA